MDSSSRKTAMDHVMWSFHKQNSASAYARTGTQFLLIHFKFQSYLHLSLTIFQSFIRGLEAYTDSETIGENRLLYLQMWGCLVLSAKPTPGAILGSAFIHVPLLTNHYIFPTHIPNWLHYGKCHHMAYSHFTQISWNTGDNT